MSILNQTAVKGETVGLLEVVSPPLRLTDSRILLGRASPQVQLLDPQVSRHHALIERHGELYLLRDLSSTNGTYVNGRPVAMVVLRDGDLITIGSAMLIFRLVQG